MARSSTLSPERIVDTASSLISERGLAGFSMRKLAVALDVTPMTLYLRFDNKEALLTEVASRNLQGIRVSIRDDDPWEQRVSALATGLRAHLVADRNLLQLYAQSDQISSTTLAAVDLGLGLMEEAGLAGEAAVAAFRVVFWHAVGSALVLAALGDLPANQGTAIVAALTTTEASERTARLGPYFGPVDADEQFQYATHCLVTGLASDIASSADSAARKELS